MNIAGFLSPSPFHPVSKTIFALSAVVAEGFDRQAAAGRNRGLTWSQENKGNGRNPHLQRHQRVRCKSSPLALQLILTGPFFMNLFQTLSLSHHKKGNSIFQSSGKFHVPGLSELHTTEGYDLKGQLPLPFVSDVSDT